MRQLRAILERRKPVLHAFSPGQTVQEAVAEMASHEIGVVPVVEDERIVGVFGERDLVRRVIAAGRSLTETRVGEVMTPDPITASPEEDRQTAILKMQVAGCRHLPIVEDEILIDMLSMRDLLFLEIEDRDQEIQALRGYINGVY
jgi:CBS domain-containing protein